MFFSSDWMQRELAWWNIPGLEIGVCDRSGTIWQQGYGWRDPEKHLPMTPDTLGPIASCTKSFTAAVIASLAADGLLSFDTPVREYIPDFALMDPAASQQCTLRDMLCHRTGLSAHDGTWPDPDTDRRAFLRRARFLEPNRPFRYSSEYNNTVYDLIGCIAEEVSGISWEELVRERVLRPLGMNRSCLTMADMMKDPDHAKGYFAASRTAPLQEMAPWEMGVGAPAAAVNSCVSEMLRWLRMHLNRGSFEGTLLFSEKMMDEMHTPTAVMDAFPWTFPEVPGIGIYGMGWKTCVYRGRILRYHCGELEGFCSMQAFLPREGFGIFILCNRHKPVTPLLLELIYTAIDRLLEYPDTDWASRLHPYAEVFSGSCDDWPVDLMSADSIPDDQSSDEWLSAACAELPGVYEHPGYGHVRIDAESGNPVLIFRTQRLRLHPVRRDLWMIRDLKEDTLYYTLPLRVIREGASARAAGITLKLDANTPPVLFIRK
ncbi:MAG: beta-lactamase family protein [Lachnospiraceae bacterium]|nr:beta-lactamase family protein [Lachnospiraceae bacterium]